MGVTSLHGAIDLDELSGLLDRWVTEGVVDAAQAERMHRDLRGLEPTARRGSVAVEALGYLGGAIVLAGSMLITAWYWGDLTSGGRLGIVAGTTVALLLAGLVVPWRTSAAGRRLRGVLWLAATAALSGALGLLAGDVLDLRPRTALVVVCVGAAAFAGALWWVARSAVQQLAMMVTLAAAAAAVLLRADIAADLPGLGVWGVGVAWAVLGWAGLLAPRRLALALGTAMAIVGAMMTSGSDAGQVLVLVTVAAGVVTAIALSDLTVLAVAAVGALVNIPAAMTRWFPDSLAGAFVLVAVGLALVGVALGILRRERHGAS